MLHYWLTKSLDDFFKDLLNLTSLVFSRFDSMFKRELEEVLLLHKVLFGTWRQFAYSSHLLDLNLAVSEVVCVKLLHQLAYYFKICRSCLFIFCSIVYNVQCNKILSLYNYDVLSYLRESYFASPICQDIFLNFCRISSIA